MLDYLSVQPKQNGPLKLNIGQFCPTCGYQNPDDATFCLNCAAALGATCPTCQQLAAAGSKFCADCGAYLSTGVSIAQPDERELAVLRQVKALVPTPFANKICVTADNVFGERREVTALWIGLRGWNKLEQAPDDELLFSLKDEIFQRLAEVIDGYEGIIDKFTGDGLVVIFGAPVAHENDPERAVRAALELQTVMEAGSLRFKPETGLKIELSIGITTGLAVAGNVGNTLHMDYTMIGETINLAAALQQAANPGVILIDETTYQRVWPYVACQPQAPIKIEAYPEAVPVFHPLHILAQSRRDGLGPTSTLPIIGRANDLARLNKALTDVIQLGHSRVALVTGEAGLGKSRLVAEFCHLVDHAEVEIYQGEGVTYARSTPLWAAASLLRRVLALFETDSLAVQRQKLYDKLEHLGLAGPDIAPYLATVLGLKPVEAEAQTRLSLLDAAMLQRQTHAALRQLFLTMARQKPMILIFENLQLIDPASRDFLEYLIQSGGDIPVLLLLVARSPEQQSALEPLVETIRRGDDRLVEIHLQPLADHEAQLLVDQLILSSSGELQQLKNHVLRRAEGNPLFIEAIVSMLVEQGGLEREPLTNSWMVLPQATALLNAVPRTIKGLLLARFDRLPEGLRRTLHKASVFGTAFPLALLQAINDPDPAATSAQLDELVARQFLTAQPFRGAPGYVFCQTLLQESVYETLLRRDRQKIHTLVAEVIELSDLWRSAEQAEILAYHYTESTLPQRAVPYLLTAGDNAARRCAYETAIHHYRQAIKQLPAAADNYDDAFFRVRLGLGAALKFVGDLAEAGEVLEEALQQLWQSALAAEAGKLQAMLVEALHQIADVRQREGAYEAALRYLEMGLKLLEGASTQTCATMQRALLERSAWIHFRQGQLDQARSIAQTATQNASQEQVEDPIILASLYNTLGGIAWQQGDWKTAIRHVERSMVLYNSLGYLYGVATAYGNLGILYQQQGRWAEAIHYFKQAYTVHRTIGNREGQAVSLNNLGLLYLTMGKYYQARQELEAALAIRQRLGDTWGTAQTQVNLAHLALTQGQLTEATHWIQQGIDLARAIGNPEIQVESLWLSALLHAEKNQTPADVQAAEEALALAQQTGLKQQQVDCIRVLGHLRRRTGQFKQAEALLQQALTQAKTHDDPYQQGLVWQELGCLYQTQRQARAVLAFQTAAELFKQVGADQRLHDVRAALARL